MRVSGNKKIYDDRTKYILDVLDYILDEYHCDSFSEYVGRVGGDAVTYRVYGTDGNYTLTQR